MQMPFKEKAGAAVFHRFTYVPKYQFGTFSIDGPFAAQHDRLFQHQLCCLGLQVWRVAIFPKNNHTLSNGLIGDDVCQDYISFNALQQFLHIGDGQFAGDEFRQEGVAELG